MPAGTQALLTATIHPARHHPEISSPATHTAISLGWQVLQYTNISLIYTIYIYIYTYIYHVILYYRTNQYNQSRYDIYLYHEYGTITFHPAIENRENVGPLWCTCQRRKYERLSVPIPKIRCFLVFAPEWMPTSRNGERIAVAAARICICHANSYPTSYSFLVDFLIKDSSDVNLIWNMRRNI